LLPVAALRVEPVAALRFVLAERPLFADAFERVEDALRALLAPAATAGLRRDFVLFDRLLALRDEALLPDFPRDFLALVAIDALLESLKKPSRR